MLKTSEIALPAAVVILLAYIFFSNVQTQPMTVQTVTTTEFVSSPSYSKATINLVAVDQDGNGASMPLTVEARPGSGRVLTNINEVLVWWVSTQQSIQTAKDVASNITKVNLSNIDLVYTLNTNATLIEGPSAGAAITAATIAALENKTLKSGIVVTGTINPDGSVGPVGGISEKAKAAKDVGATLFLVPKGQGVQSSYKTVKTCENLGSLTYCSTDYKVENVDISKSVGIDTKEVSNISDVLKYII